MKKPSQTILLLLVAATFAFAGTTTVDFSSLALPININNGVGTTVNGVGFLYEPGGDPLAPPSNCNFDAGLGGTQFFDTLNFPGGCVGGQVDNLLPGLSGTTDGVYQVTFASEIWNLHLVYGMFSLLTPAPAEGDYSINAVLYDGVNMVGIATGTGSSGTLDTNLFYQGPFNRALLLFSPVTPLDGTGAPLAPWGQSLGQVSEFTFSTPEPDAIWLLLIGLFGIGANRLVRRRA